MINNKNCGSGDAIVGYIYNELPPTDRLAFEDHLLDCNACTDEFAAIANSRYSVYEWQKLEFEPMPTPHFAIPWRADTLVRMSAEHKKPLRTKSFTYQPTYADKATALRTRVSAPHESWFDSIKSVFATGPRLATAGAFGLLIVAVGFAAIFISTGPTEVVSINDIQVTDTFLEPLAKPAENTPVSVPKPVEPEEGRVSPEFAVVEKPAPKVEQRRKRSTVRRNNPRPQNIGNETQAKAPRLNEFEDLSDDSLRLSDLVADVDSRD